MPRPRQGEVEIPGLCFPALEGGQWVPCAGPGHPSPSGVQEMTRVYANPSPP